MKLTKRQVRASRIGAVVGLVALLLSVAFVGYVNASLREVAAEDGMPSPQAEVLWSLEDYSETWQWKAYQSGCFQFPMNFNFNPVGHYNSTAGVGLGVNFTQNLPWTPCVSGSEVYEIVVGLYVTAEDVLEMGAEGVSVAWTTTDPLTPNRTLEVGIGLLQEGSGIGTKPSFPAGMPLKASAVEGFLNLWVFDVDTLASLATFPDMDLALYIRGDSSNMPDYPEEWNIDVTLWGDAEDAGNATAATDLFDVFSESDVLSVGYYSVAFFATIGALLLWPTTELKLWGGRR